jgi:hypothetical protein
VLCTRLALPYQESNSTLSAGFGESRQKKRMKIGTIVDVFGEPIGISRWGKM